jgi:hypothetical protein
MTQVIQGRKVTLSTDGVRQATDVISGVRIIDRANRLSDAALMNMAAYRALQLTTVAKPNEGVYFSDKIEHDEDDE